MYSYEGARQDSVNARYQYQSIGPGSNKNSFAYWNDGFVPTRRFLKRPTLVGIGLVTLVIVLLILIAVVLGFALSAKKNADDQYFQINIHIKLSQQCEDAAISINRQAAAMDPNVAIDLQTAQQPHITLYLTSFSHKGFDSIKAAMAQVVSKFGHCEIDISNETSISGQWVMWEVVDTACLQYMSDAVVNATRTYIQPNQEVPSWVYTMPEPVRDEKIAYVQLYGSPNVFDQFQPHVTLATDSTTPDLLDQVAKNITIPTCSYVVTEVALGTVGPFGTVMRGQDMGSFAINPNNTMPTEQ